MSEPQTTNLETCDRCCGTGWMHPDNPAGKCAKCNGSGGIPRMTDPQLRRGSVGKRVLDPGTLPHQTTPLILRLLREERDRIERRMDQFNTTRSHGHQPMPWFDDESHLAGERLKLAECNAAVAGIVSGQGSRDTDG